MAEPADRQIEQLRTTIATLEAQRSLLGAAIVDGALAPLRQELAVLEARRTPAPADERRVISILFTDIVGSTSLAELLDPEEWRRMVGEVHAAVGGLIAQHGGLVAQYLGDGLLAFWGAQQATERDPENAIRAALSAQAAIRSLAVSHPIQIRIGINTGLVVVGELGSEAKRELTAAGDAMNVAARLQSVAPPGGVLISHDTYQHVRGVFHVTPQPPLTLKGRREPVQTYLVRRAKPQPFRMVSRGVRGIETRTVGRAREFQQLQQAYIDAYEHRHAVWTQLIGDAGVGKSRLLADLNEWLDLRPEDIRLLRARAFEGDDARPYALVRRLWFERFQIAEDAPLAQAEAKWVKGFRELSGIEAEEPAHALGLLLGLPFNDSPFIRAMRNDPTQVRGRGLVVSRDLLRGLRREVPAVVLLEDLQWTDASSREYLEEVLLAEQEKQDESLQGIFTLATGRPEWGPPQLTAEGDSLPHIVSIPLAPLSDEATRELGSELLRDVEGVPDQLLDLLVQRAEGIPFYAEELVNWFLDHGILDKSSQPWRFFPQRLKESPLPGTLQHLLLTRLSALSENERGALQRGAIFGRRFWSGGIEALGIRQSTEVMLPLQPRGLIEAQPESSFEGEQEWSFHHALLRDVTYESVLKRERGRLHQAAAEWLEAQAERAGRLDEFAGLIGEHCERAGELSSAADWYLRAGERALASGALVEAHRLFDRALELLPPDDRGRRWRGLWGREAVLDLRGERKAEQRDVEALLGLAEVFDDPLHRAEARFRQTALFKSLGDDRAAVTASEATIAAAQRAGNLAVEVKALGYQTVSLTRLGDLTAAREAAQKTLERAEAVEDQAALGFALLRVAIHYNELGDLSRAAELLSQAADIARRVGDRLAEAGSVGNLASAYCALGLYKLAKTALEQALVLSEEVGSRRTRAYDLLNLGQVHYWMRDGRAAQRLTEEALAEGTAVGDAYLVAECRFYLGLIAEWAGDYASAVRRFTQVEEDFSRLGLLGYTMKVSAGLARCALAEGRLEEARQRAVEIWNYLKEHGTAGVNEKVVTFQAIAEIFDAVGETAQSRAVVEAGHHELMQDADKISDLKWRKSFLDNVEPNRAIVEMWERMHGWGRPDERRIDNQQSPLGFA